MKIAIPVNEKSTAGEVCISFGRAPYFLIYDTETKASDFINNGGASSQGGAGIKAAQTVVDSKVEALLTPRCGENAAQVITAAGIQMYKTKENSIQDNIAAFIAGKLNLLAETHPGFHGAGNQ